MLSLYESILKSTNSGRASLPLEFSEFYTPKECAKAIKDFCKYYQIKDRKLMVQIERSIDDFVKNKMEMEYFIQDGKLYNQMFHITKFRFVKDIAFKDKLLAQSTRVTEKNLYAIYFGQEKDLFLIFQAIFDKKKLWYHLLVSNTALQVGENSYLGEFLKKYENR